MLATAAEPSSLRGTIRSPRTSGRAHDDITYAIGPTPFGLALVATTNAGLRAVLLGDDRSDLESDVKARFRSATIVAAVRGADRAGDALRDRVLAHLGASAGAVDVPLDLHGTPFQQQVWRELRRIPAGATTSYAEIATRIGRPEAVRAVAGAIGANPVAVVVPCHRVVRSDGSLSGYRWGVERKRAVLASEGVEVVSGEEPALNGAKG